MSSSGTLSTLTLNQIQSLESITRVK